jgi:asparagine synthase (glutamine-hydrolysing)
MSAQFGRWNFAGDPLSVNDCERAEAILASYGPDDRMIYTEPGVAILYRAFHTTKESHREIQPHPTQSGALITWDGRLDNRFDLLRELNEVDCGDNADVSIVGRAYDRWGIHSFRKLVGDWALSVWIPTDRTLILAKDFLGSRHLYYSIEDHQVIWSTVLDPLVLLSSRALSIDEEYLAGWLSFFPNTRLTPYSEIHSVPPSSYVVIKPHTQTVRKHWDFDGSKRIRYRAEHDYQDHFLCAFSQSVRRRLRSEAPVLAELSGGMDSSSIVCMADDLMQNGHVKSPRLDTISYYDDSEPNWNERPYLKKVEEGRGRAGCHIDVSSLNSLLVEFSKAKPAVTPDSPGQTHEGHRQLAACLAAQGNRVILSGIGGDEVFGGVPAFVPELADLFASGHWRTFARRSLAWALANRTPVWRLTAETIQAFLPVWSVGTTAQNRPPKWLDPRFVRRQRAALHGYPERLRIFGSLPSLQSSVSTLESLRRQLSCSRLSPETLYEKRYPYLDRDLLEFLFAIPRQQLLRPGHRRSLMRRAFTGIVPDEILNRRRKAFIVRRPVKELQMEWSSIAALTEHMVGVSLNLVNEDALAKVLRNARNGMDTHFVFLMRTLAMESWLRHIRDSDLISISNHSNWPMQSSASVSSLRIEVRT